MIFRTLKPGEEEAWANHCATVFQGPTDTPEFFMRHYLNDPYHEPEGIFIAEDNGRIASAVHVFKRELYIQGQRVGMGGIADVSTLEEYRRIGLNGKLLTMAIGYMNDKRLPVSLLFTGTNHHYARYGWFTHAMRRTRVALDLEAPLPDGTRIEPLSDGHFDAAAGLYALTAARFSGVMVREHPDYDAWVRREITNPLALIKDNALAAYIDYITVKDGALALTEYAALPGGDYYLELLSAAAKRVRAPAYAYVPSAFAPGESGPFDESMGAMLRLNAPFTLKNRTVDTPGKLASAMEDMVFFKADGF